MTKDSRLAVSSWLGALAFFNLLHLHSHHETGLEKDLLHDFAEVIVGIASSDGQGCSSTGLRALLKAESTNYIADESFIKAEWFNRNDYY